MKFRGRISTWEALVKSDFEGTLVLEKLAEVDSVDEFFEAVDADDFAAAARLMRAAAVDEQTIAIVLQKMQDPGDH